MKARWLLGAAMATFVLAHGPAADAAKGQDALAAFVGRVTAEVGVETGTLAVLPLVLKEAPAASVTLGVPHPTTRWMHVPDRGSPDLVEIVAPPPEAGFRAALAPAGTLLYAGRRERMLTRTIPLLPGEKVTAAAVITDSGRAAAGIAR